MTEPTGTIPPGAGPFPHRWAKIELAGQLYRCTVCSLTTDDAHDGPGCPHLGRGMCVADLPTRGKALIPARTWQAACRRYWRAQKAVGR